MTQPLPKPVPDSLPSPSLRLARKRPGTSYLATAYQDALRQLDSHAHPDARLQADALTRALQSFAAPKDKISRTVAVGAWAALRTGWYALASGKQRTFRQYCEDEILPHYRDSDIRHLINIVEWVFPILHAKAQVRDWLRLPPDERFPAGRRLTPRVLIEKKGALSNLRLFQYLIRDEPDIDKKCDLILTAVTQRRDAARAIATAQTAARVGSTIRYKETVQPGDRPWRWTFDLTDEERSLLQLALRRVAEAE